MHENEIGSKIVKSSVHIHRSLGPGLLESVYESILCKQLIKEGLFVERQKSIPVVFENEKYDEGFRADLIIENSVIIELKSVENIVPVHKKQLLTYLKLLDLRVGYLLNFGEELMKSGITRIINGQLQTQNPNSLTDARKTYNE